MPSPRDWLGSRAGIFCRVGLVIFLAVAAHQFKWEWLRFATSEIVLRLSGFLKIPALRVSCDVIELQGQQFRYLTSCTFVDVFLASIPLIWNLTASLTRNVLWLAIAGIVLFDFNVIRLEIAVLLYLRNIPWTIADGLLGGCSYFVVWLAIWYTRSWGLRIPLERGGGDHENA